MKYAAFVIALAIAALQLTHHPVMALGLAYTITGCLLVFMLAWHGVRLNLRMQAIDTLPERFGIPAQAFILALTSVLLSDANLILTAGALLIITPMPANRSAEITQEQGNLDSKVSHA